MRTRKDRELQGSDPLFVISQVLTQILSIVETHRINTGDDDSIKDLVFVQEKNKCIPADYILEEINEYLIQNFGQDIKNFQVEFFEIYGKKSFNISKEKYSIFYIIGKRDNPTIAEPKGSLVFNTGDKFNLTSGLIVTVGTQIVPPKKVTFNGYGGNGINLIRVLCYKKELLKK